MARAGHFYGLFYTGVVLRLLHAARLCLNLVGFAFVLFFVVGHCSFCIVYCDSGVKARVK